MDLDTSWCPVCSREIVPKRYQVPIAPPMPAQPAPPPSSPVLSDTAAPRRTKSTARRGGLAHGTGRVKPNGAVKTSPKPAPTPAPAAAPAAPIRTRTVIDQGPIPLYCSDECRISDINSNYLAADYDPSRDIMPAAPHNSWANIAEESDSSSGTSSDSSSWSSDCTKVSHVSPSMAAIAAMYNFPPMPAPAPILGDSPSELKRPVRGNFDKDFNNGGIMVARHIKAALCPEVVKVHAFNSGNAAPAAPRGPIKGWTDGSADWRSTVYNTTTPVDEEDRRQCHIPFGTGIEPVARTVTPVPTAPVARPPPQPQQAIRPPPARQNSDELYAKYPLSFSRRSESRTSLYTAPSTVSLPHTASASSLRSAQRQKMILKKGVEGRLLIPDVLLRQSSRTESTSSCRSSASPESISSPLQRHTSEVSEEGARTTKSVPPTSRRPVTETRSWSYDNMLTYPAMPRPSQKELRMQRCIVDGVEREIEVEVDVTQPLKRLFLFADKDPSR
ncbi:hypothetical protein FIBSPDRAFT_881649 [Athelia psychrophila]|uniref:Uncharacterized protein n=1 Tax=Athelia psychrophila TaxID=1759441 RepID=A0A166W729_9AGAM|nr:hypothetical protein FIBSPDRAFT_881649 [Fibularhizoctonia sp. CBS 109695]